MKMKPKTQRERIIAYLFAGNKVTSLSALTKFGCLRLGARISELRKKGYPIADEWITTPMTAKRVKRYYIHREDIDRYGTNSACCMSEETARTRLTIKFNY